MQGAEGKDYELSSFHEVLVMRDGDIDYHRAARLSVYHHYISTLFGNKKYIHISTARLCHSMCIYFHAVLYGIVTCAINDIPLNVYKFVRPYNKLSGQSYGRKSTPFSKFNYKPSFVLMEIIQREWVKVRVGLQKVGTNSCHDVEGSVSISYGISGEVSTANGRRSGNDVTTSKSPPCREFLLQLIECVFRKQRTFVETPPAPVGIDESPLLQSLAGFTRRANPMNHMSTDVIQTILERLRFFMTNINEQNGRQPPLPPPTQTPNRQSTDQQNFVTIIRTKRVAIDQIARICMLVERKRTSFYLLDKYLELWRKDMQLCSYV
uniref:SFRICE_018018 n=1 Tax=Spodoptera frugiperda TaxID=7108 RepID=A0A2H1VJY0_SPOFR